MGVRWYVSYPLNTRHVEELMEERGLRRKRVSCLFVRAHC
jgi:transposase-like protein